MARAEGNVASPAELISLLQHSDDPRLQDLQDLIKPPEKPQMDAVEVFPEPGFVVKTVDEQGRKVFINVCSSSKVAMPSGWKSGEVPADVRRVLESKEAAAPSEQAPATQELMRVPLSMGEPRVEADHKGEPCTVFDCILSSELLQLASSYRPLKYFVIQLAMGWAESKNQLQLDPQYKLPKMRYKGDAPLPQFIRPEASKQQQQQQQQLIREVAQPEAEVPALRLPVNKAEAAASSRAAAAAPAAAAKAARQQAAAAETVEAGGRPELAQLQHAVEFSGRPVESVHITVPLPPGAAATAVRHPDSVSVQVAGEVVRIAAPGCQQLAVQLPLAVTTKGGAAELQAGGRQLCLRLPYRPLADVVHQLQQQQKLLAARGDNKEEHSTVMELD